MFVYFCHLLRLKIASPEDTPVEPVYPSLSNTHNVEMLIFCFNCIKFKNNCKTNVLLSILHLEIPFFLCSSIRIYHIRWVFSLVSLTISSPSRMRTEKCASWQMLFLIKEKAKKSHGDKLGEKGELGKTWTFSFSKTTSQSGIYVIRRY